MSYRSWAVLKRLLSRTLSFQHTQLMACLYFLAARKFFWILLKRNTTLHWVQICRHIKQIYIRDRWKSSSVYMILSAGVDCVAVLSVLIYIGCVWLFRIFSIIYVDNLHPPMFFALWPNLKCKFFSQKGQLRKKCGCWKLLL